MRTLSVSSDHQIVAEIELKQMTTMPRLQRQAAGSGRKDPLANQMTATPSAPGRVRLNSTQATKNQAAADIRL